MLSISFGEYIFLKAVWISLSAVRLANGASDSEREAAGQIPLKKHTSPHTPQVA